MRKANSKFETQRDTVDTVRKANSKFETQRNTADTVRKANSTFETQRDTADTVRKANSKFETRRVTTAKERCRRQKERAASQSSSVHAFVCPKCSVVCASKIGVYSYQRVCKD